MIGRRIVPEVPPVWVTIHDIVTAGFTELGWNHAQREIYCTGVLARAEGMGIEVTSDFAGRPRVSEADAVRLWEAIAAAALADRDREEAEREAARLVERDRGAGRLELNARELLSIRGMAQFIAENPDKAPQVFDEDDPASPLNQQRRPVIAMQSWGPGDQPK